MREVIGFYGSKKGVPDNVKRLLKTPISYYGGKQTLATKIINLFPDHQLYGEPFIGGAAVFFAKTPSPIEVINDLDHRVITFYRVAKSEFKLLKYLIDSTPVSRAVYYEALKVLEYPDVFSEIKRAWAFWVGCQMSFASSLGSGFAYDKLKGSTEKKIINKKLNFTEEIPNRLDKVQIECYDALKVIKSRDHEHSFFYCDPPYPDTCLGHYDGYTMEDFEELLKTAESLKGKFLLSSYDYEILDRYAHKNGWEQVKIEMSLSANKGANKRKVEVLTANYPIREKYDRITKV